MRIIFCLFFAAFIAFSFAKEQTVKVRGQLFCNGRDARSTLVELREKDTLDPDDTLASAYTDINGEFRLTGTDDEFTAIQPYLRITHTCGVINRGHCHRISDIEIDKKEINNQEFEIGSGPVNLYQLEFKEICD